jgi:hypothetical protein
MAIDIEIRAPLFDPLAIQKPPYLHLDPFMISKVSTQVETLPLRSTKVEGRKAKDSLETFEGQF